MDVVCVQCLTLRTFVKIPSVPIKDFSDVIGFDFFLVYFLNQFSISGYSCQSLFALITSAVIAIY